MHTHFRVDEAVDHTGARGYKLIYLLPFKSLGSVQFLKEVFNDHQICIYLIKNTVKTVTL